MAYNLTALMLQVQQHQQKSALLFTIMQLPLPPWLQTMYQLLKQLLCKMLRQLLQHLMTHLQAWLAYHSQQRGRTMRRTKQVLALKVLRNACQMRKPFGELTLYLLYCKVHPADRVAQGNPFSGLQIDFHVILHNHALPWIAWPMVYLYQSE